MMLDRTIRWRPLDAAGLEHLEITETPAGILARSVLIGEREGTHFGVYYEVELAPNWSFRSLRLERTDGARLELNADGEGNWTDGQHLQLPELDGCIDIDVSGSPFTNTLPIRRTRFSPGEPARFTMAWIPLDTLAPVADEQIYTLLDDGRYLYESGDGAFRAELEVDADGLVTYYPTLFERA
jgi:hypothetical protein